jgi:hypothetical protein
MSEHSHHWYLMKQSDASVFGPMSLEQLRDWAACAYVSPLDKVSSDSVNWVRAPMLPELGMDYLLHVGPDAYYGPTTAGAIREFLDNGEITLDAVVTNCTTGVEGPLRSFGLIAEIQEIDRSTPSRSSLRDNLQKRVRELEEALMEERRLRHQAEEHCAKVKAQLAKLEDLLS